MARCVVHLKKISGMGLGGVRNHMDRTGVSRTNPDIVRERSSQNYAVSGFSDATHLERRINSRIKELNLKKAVRRDAVRLVDIVVTSSRDGIAAMGKEGEKAFFVDAAAFLAARFGRENIMYANVHKDEAVPHLHLGFVPVTADGRLAAKSLLTQKSLRDLQTDFWQEVGLKYGLDRGEPTVTPKKHIETERHKAEHAKNEAIQAREKATQEEKRAAAARAVNAEKDALIEKSTDAKKKVAEVKAEKAGGGFFGRPYYKLSVPDYDRLRDLAEKGADAIEEHLAMKSAVETAQAAAESAREEAEVARQAQEAAEKRAVAAEAERAKKIEAVETAAAPFLDAPDGAGRALALQGIDWAKGMFRAVYDTIARRLAMDVCRGEKPKAVLAHYAQPMKEVRMPQEVWFPKRAAKAMAKQIIKGKQPETPVGAGWIVKPEAVDYKRPNVPTSILAAVLSQPAVATLRMPDDDGNDLHETWELMNELERDEAASKALWQTI